MVVLLLFYRPSLRATSRTPPCGRRTRSRGSPFLAQVLLRPRCRCLGKSATGIKGTKAPGARLMLCLAEGLFPALSGCSGRAGLPELTPPTTPGPASCGLRAGPDDAGPSPAGQHTSFLEPSPGVSLAEAGSLGAPGPPSGSVVSVNPLPLPP